MPGWTETSVAGEIVRAFVPDPPQVDLSFTSSDITLIAEAAAAVGRLDGQARDLIDPGVFTYLYVRQEAVLSSQIEGTQSSLNDLLSYEQDVETKVPLNDVAEVSRYVKALEYGVEQLRSPTGLPMSLRLIRELHALLLEDGRGSHQRPGEFRTSQNWIGGTRPGNAAFVPPPHELLAASLLPMFEQYLHVAVAPLVRAGIAHAYFETLHPFLDGNGRVGRLLIPLLLIHDRQLTQPHLYVSLYFKQHRQEYYARLEATRDQDDWLGWLRFFFTAVAMSASQAVAAARDAVAVYDADVTKARALPGSGSLVRVLQAMRERPMMNTRLVEARVGISRPTAIAALERLAQAGIVDEVTGKQRGRVYAYRRYINALAAATL